MAQTRFLIYAQARTGSSLLVDLLRHQPAVTCDGEILKSHIPGLMPALRVRTRRTLATHAQMAWRARRASTPAYGFKLLVYQMSSLGLWSPRSFHRRGWQLINLRRRNIWRQALSNLLARHNRQWHRTKGSPPPLPPPVIPWPLLTRQLDNLAIQSARETYALKDIPFLSLTYEDDLETATSWASAINKIWSYLELPGTPSPIQANLARTYDEPLERIIPNYADLCRALFSSPYAHLVDKP